jgi:hypothetical protein
MVTIDPVAKRIDILTLKACFRCGGDIHTRTMTVAPDESACLQCGKVIYIERKIDDKKKYPGAYNQSP